MQCGKPNKGEVAKVMRNTRSKYHRRIKELKRTKNMRSKTRMAEAIVNNRARDFWLETRKMNKNNRSTPPHVDGITEQEEITKLFERKYKDLLNCVSYEEKEMHHIMNEVNYNITEDEREHIVSEKEIMKAIKKLKTDKYDGSEGTYSNHFKWGPNILHELLSYLYTSMYAHGYNSEDLLKGTLISIPKNTRKSLSDSSNYRGITLCSALCKISDNIILNRYKDRLYTSDLQYAFKSEHSTIECSMVVQETIRYYLENGSNIYACLIDSSKAFDRVEFTKLFELLKDRKMPNVIIRFIIDSYIHQKLRSSWNGNMSSYFDVTNGTKQGQILSPILYGCYMDYLLLKLKKNDVGCHVGNQYVGAVSYADDLILLSPSMNGLQMMIDECEEYAKEFSVKYNVEKTLCIKFTKGDDEMKRDIFLNGKKLKWVKKVKHLGILLKNDTKDTDEIMEKKNDFVSRINMLLTKFYMGDVNTRKTLFKSFCTSMYGCVLWDVTSKAFMNFKTSYNNGIRRILNLPRNSHKSIIYCISNCVMPEYCIYKRLVKMMQNMYKSNNCIMNYFSIRAVYGFEGFIGKTISIIYKNFPILLSDIITKSKTVTKIIDEKAKYVDDNVKALCLNIIDLLDNRIEGLTTDERISLIEFLSTQ